MNHQLFHGIFFTLLEGYKKFLSWIWMVSILLIDIILWIFSWGIIMFDTTYIALFCFHVMNEYKVQSLSRERVTNGYFHLPFSNPCPVSIETIASPYAIFDTSSRH